MTTIYLYNFSAVITMLEKSFYGRRRHRTIHSKHNLCLRIHIRARYGVGVANIHYMLCRFVYLHIKPMGLWFGFSFLYEDETRTLHHIKNTHFNDYFC